ncbi:glycoside hydrolase family 68 protein [Streptomyces radicis]|uniref:Glycosyl hydrolase family 32 n=1 Tax=Streptomyces radicis TaxID=1750517 RepID=A0A3A9WMD4_9ACTN|nr:glycoside hydrolase family 68 protein [Streptomyces radicis]RKN10634.1 glycosyl hydrolase family 32 [Streptomyces radicis]RKN24894.1 glycosyl hydrolase family 32 [Streptomyces radicis]
MTFALDDHWVWDFWLAETGDLFHLFYLHAPRSLGDPDLRHRNASIGHAVSRDLRHWADRGPVLGPGNAGDFDETATWTGSVIRAPDGSWRMFYTGARFPSADSPVNIETIGVATSADLATWTKSPTPALAADPRWYETLPDRTWREEAWRDPWVFADPGGDGWHMLITARAAHGDPLDRGVVAHAMSPDLETWTVREPLSAPGAGFAHLEVPQLVTIEGRGALLFSCDTAHLAGERRTRGERGGIWAVAVEGATGPIRPAEAARVTGDDLYSGRAVRDATGRWVLLAFENVGRDGDFVGRVCDPLPLGWSDDGRLSVVVEEPVR